MSKFDRIMMKTILKEVSLKLFRRHIILAAMFSIFSSSAFALNNNRCATANETKSINNRVMQSELMVAALSCGKANSYNSFLNKFKNEIKQDKKNIRKYFSRVYNEKSEKHLNGFITKLANKSSERSLGSSSREFCLFADQLFEFVLDEKTNSMVRVSSDRYFSNMHNISNCEDDHRKWL